MTPMHLLQSSHYGHMPNGQTNGSQSTAPGTQSASNLPWGGPFPSLHLWPIQDTFAMKMIHLPEGQRIKIGRQTNAKTVPGERNAYFDSKVLSRTHAEIWEQGGKIYIKDLKSSNGTFINNERLSPEGVESEPVEVKSEDIVEFGIDIVSEDNRTIVHHKVAAKVYCVFNPDDAALSARELVHYQTNDNRSRRAPPVPGQLGPPVTSSGGKPSGLTFDHVLNKLQSEIQKSKETGAELRNITTAMTDIQDTLGGGLPPSQNGSADRFIPPQYRSMSNEAQVALAGPHGQQAAAFISLQNQLGETQASLSTQLDKIQQLEGQWREHEHLRNEITSLRNQVDTSRREMELLLARSSHDDDDDARSVITLMDSEEAAERVRSRRNLDVPGTPDPQTELVNRIQSLSAEIAEAVQLSRALQTQHAEAMTAVRQLTLRVGALEAGMAAQVAEQVGKAEQRWESWRAKCEEGWKRERESWESERERLRGVVREWEEASRRGHEEEEDRELNESLSGDDEQEDSLTDEDLPPGPTPVLRSKARRRRPSHRTTLAVRALKGVIDANGALTPKADVQTLDEPRAASTRLRVRELRNSSARRRSPRGDPNGKDSSESGRDSGDTLKESEKGVRKSKNSPPRPPLQPIQVLTVLMVAAVAGALYWKHRE
ncbi:cell cycle arrest in response to pheromone-related protein [Papiliotrema laurentii]|uniref:Cell cycle arrest in response to pheromone-related protein n=1 Tax=Papiliotrema laurentii TaxID=5418 RepID=A0AAD9FMB4_PAPLA|nr:cell cycle arrest in response to pheromone-related protein [Papiliotrema laurentii]